MEPEIIEIGAYKIDDFGTVTDKFVSLVRPVAHPVLSLYCKRLTGIRQPDINRAPHFATVVEHFWHWLDLDEDYRLCAWGKKDMEFLLRECRANRLDEDWLDAYLDLKIQYRRIRRLPKAAGLLQAMKREGLEHQGVKHRALDDAFNTAQLFLKLWGMWEF